ncbi:MAG: DUF2628 domain-containing protein [Pseudomonadota bacterium]
MAVYTVHQPPLGKGENTPDPARFTFVRDGFYVWGFLLTVLWMLRHRLWLVALLFVAGTVLLDIGLRYAGVTSGWRTLTFVAIAFLVGLEGATLRRWTLARRGFTNVGVVVADDPDDAERRFFVNWQAGKRPNAAPPPARAESVVRGPVSLSPGAIYPRSDSSGVLGSFPEPDRRT